MFETRRGGKETMKRRKGELTERKKKKKVDVSKPMRAILFKRLIGIERRGYADRDFRKRR